MLTLFRNRLKSESVEKSIDRNESFKRFIENKAVLWADDNVDFRELFGDLDTFLDLNRKMSITRTSGTTLEGILIPSKRVCTIVDSVLSVNYVTLVRGQDNLPDYESVLKFFGFSSTAELHSALTNEEKVTIFTSRLSDYFTGRYDRPDTKIILELNSEGDLQININTVISKFKAVSWEL